MRDVESERARLVVCHPREEVSNDVEVIQCELCIIRIMGCFLFHPVPNAASAAPEQARAAAAKLVSPTMALE